MKKMLQSLALLLFLSTIIVSTQCKTIQINDLNLIQNTCKKTPNYTLCIRYLKADPRSSNADVAGLALILVDVIKNKGTTTIKKINQLILSNPPHDIKVTLSSCESKYKTILTSDVPQATYALQTGNPKFAEDGINDAGLEAAFCERDFNGKSPITYDNNAMRDVTSIASAIVKVLL